MDADTSQVKALPLMIKSTLRIVLKCSIPPRIIIGKSSDHYTRYGMSGNQLRGLSFVRLRVETVLVELIERVLWMAAGLYKPSSVHPKHDAYRFKWNGGWCVSREIVKRAYPSFLLRVDVVSIV